LNFNLKNKITFLIAPALICWCLFSVQGCKQPGVQDSSLLTKSDNLSLSKDTLSIAVVSQYEAPLTANLVTQGVLGNIWDKNFGTEYGSFAAQCDLTTSSVYFGLNTVLDSVVLTLAYNGSYGPCNQPVNIAVYELSQNLIDSLTYYTNSNLPVKTPAIGQLNHFVPDFYDSVYVSAIGANEPPHIRIPLSAAFGNKLLTADSLALSTDSNWLNFFHGIYVTTTSSATGNGMMYISLASALTGVTLYYNYSAVVGETNNTLGSYTFPFAGVTINHFDNAYNNTAVNSAVKAGNPASVQKIYIEGGSGLRGKITLSLDSLDKAVGVRNIDSISKKIGINKAELVLTLSAPDSQYTAPETLNLGRIDDAGQNIAVDDESLAGFGGIEETDMINYSSTNLLTRYRFNISIYFEKLIQGIYHNNGLLITVPNANQAVDRLVLTNSSTNKNYKVSLAITYTKL
jgi:hypothetical protein